VIASPSEVVLGEQKKNGEQSIVYSKTMADGTVYYVEVVSRKKGQLSAKTMYKRVPRTVDANSDSRTRSPNVRNDAGVSSEGGQQSTDVKADTGTTAPVQGSPLRQGQPNAARVSYEGEAAEAGSALAKRKRPVSAWEVMGAIAKVVKPLGPGRLRP